MVRYLQRDGAWVRGERLSAQFGVSTRQIRNYVSAANTSGCLISSSEKGYRLLDMNPSFRMLLDAEDNPESRWMPGIFSFRPCRSSRRGRVWCPTGCR